MTKKFYICWRNFWKTKNALHCVEYTFGRKIILGSLKYTL